jgi:uncharacterized heparinase superfamily protein
MTEPPRDSIETGKRLIRVGAAADSLSVRLTQFVERLTWRTPLHDMRLKGQHPVRLVAVPVDPLPGDAGRGMALLDGYMTAFGEQRGVDALHIASPGRGAFVDYLHGFAWLRDLAAAGDRQRAQAVAEALAAQWLAAHGERVADPLWRPELTARRLMMWTTHSPLLLASTDLIYRSLVLNAIARSARHLDRTADKAPAGPARIAAWSGVVIAGLLVPGGDTRRAIGEAGLVRAFQTSLSDDGGIVTRAPAALVEAIEYIAMVRAAYDSRRLTMPEAITAPLARMVPALLGTAMGDGDVSSWQGGAPVGALRIKAAMAANNVQGRPLRQSRDWGYQRLSAAGAVLVMDAAPPPIVPVADGGCASTLAFEFSDGSERLIVNCGGAGLAAGRLPSATAQALRTTAAHSTLVVADSNSTAIHADGTLGRGVGEVELSRQESDGGSRIEARHDGYVRRHGLYHQRQLLLTADGRELRGEDSVLPGGRGRRGLAQPYALRFHLGAGVQAVATADGQAAMLRTPAGAIWQFRARADALEIDDSIWIDAAGRIVATQQIVITGVAPAGGGSIAWVLKRAR